MTRDQPRIPLLRREGGIRGECVSRVHAVILDLSTHAPSERHLLDLSVGSETETRVPSRWVERAFRSRDVRHPRTGDIR